MNLSDSILVRRDAEAAAAEFPALLVEADRIAKSVAAGLHGRRRAGQGETFWQHRPYAFGDPVAAIDWRQSARASDRLFVRENEWEIAETVYFWRDGSSSLEFSSTHEHPTKRRRADILSTALAILLAQGGERVGILGEERVPFHGRHAAARLLESLLQYRQDEPGPPLGHVQYGAKVVLLSDFFFDEDRIAERVETLTEAGITGALIQVVDPCEEEFPFSGRVRFKNIANDEHITFGNTTQIRRSYLDVFAAHRDMLHNLATRTGWSLITHRTDNPAETALLSLYTALSDQKATLT